MKKQDKKSKDNWLVKSTSLSLEILLYTIVFIVLEAASVEQAVKASVVLAIGIRFAIHLWNNRKKR
jgi:hypothetical protein